MGELLNQPTQAQTVNSLSFSSHGSLSGDARVPGNALGVVSVPGRVPRIKTAYIQVRTKAFSSVIKEFVMKKKSDAQDAVERTSGFLHFTIDHPDIQLGHVIANN